MLLLDLASRNLGSSHPDEVASSHLAQLSSEVGGDDTNFSKQVIYPGMIQSPSVTVTKYQLAMLVDDECTALLHDVALQAANTRGQISPGTVQQTHQDTGAHMRTEAGSQAAGVVELQRPVDSAVRITEHIMAYASQFTELLNVFKRSTSYNNQANIGLVQLCQRHFGQILDVLLGHVSQKVADEDDNRRLVLVQVPKWNFLTSAVQHTEMTYFLNALRLGAGK